MKLDSDINDNENKNEDKKENKPEKIDFTGCIFFSKYQVVKKITEGSFSQIYQLINEDGEYFCGKIEPKNSPQPLLDHESKIMNYLFGTKIP